jgi:hypothetical protein
LEVADGLDVRVVKLEKTVEQRQQVNGFDCEASAITEQGILFPLE